MKTKICYLTYTDGKTPLPKGWERWFSTTYQLFYYRYIDNNRHKQIQWKSPKKFNKYNYSPTLETVIDFNLKDDLKKIYLIDTDEIVIDFNLKDDLKKIYLIDTDKDIGVILN
jgi:hypothetical protein